MSKDNVDRFTCDRCGHETYNEDEWIPLDKKKSQSGNCFLIYDGDYRIRPKADIEDETRERIKTKDGNPAWLCVNCTKGFMGFMMEKKNEST